MSYNQKSAGNLNINRYRGSVQETPEPKAVGDRLTLSGSNYKQTKTSARGRTAGASTCMSTPQTDMKHQLTDHSSQGHLKSSPSMNAQLKHGQAALTITAMSKQKSRQGSTFSRKSSADSRDSQERAFIYPCKAFRQFLANLTPEDKIKISQTNTKSQKKLLDSMFRHSDEGRRVSNNTKTEKELKDKQSTPKLYGGKQSKSATKGSGQKLNRSFDMQRQSTEGPSTQQERTAMRQAQHIMKKKDTAPTKSHTGYTPQYQRTKYQPATHAVQRSAGKGATGMVMPKQRQGKGPEQDLVRAMKDQIVAFPRFSESASSQLADQPQRVSRVPYRKQGNTQAPKTQSSIMEDTEEDLESKLAQTQLGASYAQQPHIQIQNQGDQNILYEDSTPTSYNDVASHMPKNLAAQRSRAENADLVHKDNAQNMSSFESIHSKSQASNPAFHQRHTVDFGGMQIQTLDVAEDPRHRQTNINIGREPNFREQDQLLSKESTPGSRQTNTQTKNTPKYSKNDIFNDMSKDLNKAKRDSKMVIASSRVSLCPSPVNATENPRTEQSSAPADALFEKRLQTLKAIRDSQEKAKANIQKYKALRQQKDPEGDDQATDQEKQDAQEKAQNEAVVDNQRANAEAPPVSPLKVEKQRSRAEGTPVTTFTVEPKRSRAEGLSTSAIGKQRKTDVRQLSDPKFNDDLMKYSKDDPQKPVYYKREGREARKTAGAPSLERNLDQFYPSQQQMSAQKSSPRQTIQFNAGSTPEHQAAPTHDEFPARKSRHANLAAKSHANTRQTSPYATKQEMVQPDIPALYNSMRDASTGQPQPRFQTQTDNIQSAEKPTTEPLSRRLRAERSTDMLLAEKLATPYSRRKRAERSTSKQSPATLTNSLYPQQQVMSSYPTDTDKENDNEGYNGEGEQDKNQDSILPSRYNRAQEAQDTSQDQEFVTFREEKESQEESPEEDGLRQTTEQDEPLQGEEGGDQPASAAEVNTEENGPRASESKSGRHFRKNSTAVNGVKSPNISPRKTSNELLSNDIFHRSHDNNAPQTAQSTPYNQNTNYNSNAGTKTTNIGTQSYNKKDFNQSKPSHDQAGVYRTQNNRPTEASGYNQEIQVNVTNQPEAMRTTFTYQRSPRGSSQVMSVPCLNSAHQIIRHDQCSESYHVPSSRPASGQNIYIQTDNGSNYIYQSTTPKTEFNQNQTSGSLLNKDEATPQRPGGLSEINEEEQKKYFSAKPSANDYTTKPYEKTVIRIDQSNNFNMPPFFGSFDKPLSQSHTPTISSDRLSQLEELFKQQIVANPHGQLDYSLLMQIQVEKKRIADGLAFEKKPDDLTGCRLPDCQMQPNGRLRDHGVQTDIQMPKSTNGFPTDQVSLSILFAQVESSYFALKNVMSGR